MNESQKCWWEQAKSDLDVLLLLRKQGINACHQLHYFQMITEKLSKAYFWRFGKPPEKSHKGFSKFMRVLLKSNKKRDRDKLARIFGFKKFEEFQSWTANVMPAINSIEKLAPALAGEGPNAEYPWPYDRPSEVPASHQFDVWIVLQNAQGRKLWFVIERAVKNFDEFA